MAEQEAFTCPFCGAPYKEFIPAGVVQVKCRYCEATVLVPPRLGGTVQRCPNHPDVLATGLCNDCGKGYCDRCLYIHKVKDARLFICSRCYKSRNSMKYAGVVIALAFSVLFFAVSFFMLTVPRSSTPASFFALLFSAVLLLVTSSLALSEAKAIPISVHDAPGPTAKSFLKLCAHCGKEIPIASEECAFCGTKQPEYVEV